MTNKKIIDFLNEHRVDTETPTHLSYGIFNGKFKIVDGDYDKFMKLYKKAIESGEELSILEKQLEYGPLIFDFDLESSDEGNRLYDYVLIEQLNKFIYEAIDKFLDINPKEIKLYLFEKPHSTVKDNMTKDGFHITLPETCVSIKMRHLIRHELVKLCDEANIFDKYTKGPDKIIDKAVASSNAWFLYGSKKPTGQLYTLSKIYNIEGLDYNHKTKTFTDDELIDFFSIRKDFYNKENETGIRDEYINSDLHAECDKLGIDTAFDPKKFEIPIYKEDEIRKANEYVKLLNSDRADEFQEWLKVGLLLKSIDNCLLVSWRDFSKKSKKYKEGECEKLWKNIKTPSNGNILTIRSLAFWAKHDSPKEYEKFIKEEFKNNIAKSLDSTMYNLAKCVHSKYADRFVCSSIKENAWWEFVNHRWKRIQEGYTLKILFSEDFANAYNLEIAEISIKATQVTGFPKEELQRKRLIIDKIVNNLMNTNFKETLLKECKSLFYDPLFIQKLDSNIYLLGFENGVYDLENNKFRDGRPDDYITFSTKNDYVKWSNKNPFYNNINTFFQQIITNEAVRKYFLLVLSTCVSGEIKEEKFYILTGCGSNGKSLTMDLMSLALGEYFMAVPITIITRPRGTSGQAAPEKVRMKGKRCGVYSEAEDGDCINSAVMKAMISGDPDLHRDLFKSSDEMIEVRCSMKHFLTANTMPEIKDTTDGAFRRIRIIDFNSKFKDNPEKANEFQIDNKLKQKIPLWGSAFISYLIHIYTTEYKELSGIKDPVEVITSTNAYRMQNDTYADYIFSAIEKTTEFKDGLTLTQLLNKFKSWVNDNCPGFKYPKTLEFKLSIEKVLGQVIEKGKYRYIKFKTIEEVDNDIDNDL